MQAKGCNWARPVVASGDLQKGDAIHFSYSRETVGCNKRIVKVEPAD
jgi:hypothetical protein